MERIAEAPPPAAVSGKVGLAFVDAFGPTLVVAPHPDDESIGCGGVLAMLAMRRVPVFVALVSDGTGSHPRSARFLAPARRALRTAELRAALMALGVPKVGAAAPDAAAGDAVGPLFELGCVDGSVPGPGDHGFEEAVAALGEVLSRCAPSTLLVPWRRDPHPDHRAAWAIARRANADAKRPARVLEYVVWAPERARASELPQPGEAHEWRVDIGAVVGRKVAALAAHRSQLGSVIDDDPDGFVLSPAMRDRCALPVELYYESLDSNGWR